MKHNKPLSMKAGFLIFIILLCLIPAILLFCGFVLPAQYGDTFLGEMKYKVERLTSTEGKRIVLVGGSSVPFAINSELLATYFPDYEIVNFGMYADMGTVVMLDWAKAEVHEGDIFLLMPEQDTQTLSDYFSGEDVWQCADGAFELLSYLSASRFEKLAASFPGFSGRKLYYTVMGAPELQGIYARSSFNEYGDIAYPDRIYNIMSGGYNPNQRISFSESILTEEFIEEVNEFSTYLTSMGATLYYHFSPMNKLALAEETSKAQIDAYYNYLTQQINFPVLGNPHTSMLDSGWFYDTNFHLNASGSIVFTKSLIEDLKTVFKDTSLTDITLPSMPQVPVSDTDTITEGDNSCWDCFTYTLQGDGWLIDGLTQKGQVTKALTLPVTHEDKPVLGVSEALFIGNTTITTLTVQPNIGILYDSMFHGCTNLQTLILTGEPSSYSIGNSLLDGASFLIQVPSDLLDSYRRHYSWQKYSEYLIAQE